MSAATWVIGTEASLMMAALTLKLLLEEAVERPAILKLC
jgi:hypothetical protein